MPRLVKREAKGPMKIEIGGEEKWFCMCGLTQNQPFCDGSHKKTKDEDDSKLYMYIDGVRTEIKIEKIG